MYIYIYIYIVLLLLLLLVRAGFWAYNIAKAHVEFFQPLMSRPVSFKSLPNASFSRRSKDIM